LAIIAPKSIDCRDAEAPSKSTISNTFVILSEAKDLLFLGVLGVSTMKELVAE